MRYSYYLPTNVVMRSSEKRNAAVGRKRGLWPSMSLANECELLSSLFVLFFGLHLIQVVNNLNEINKVSLTHSIFLSFKAIHYHFYLLQTFLQHRVSRMSSYLLHVQFVRVLKLFYHSMPIITKQLLGAR